MLKRVKDSEKVALNKDNSTSASNGFSDPGQFRSWGKGP